MALDFTYQPPPPLAVPGTPSMSRQSPGAGAMQALTAIMAQRMSKKVQAEQAQGIAQAQTDVVKLFGNQGAVERMPVRYIDFTRFKGMTRQEFKDNLMSSPEIQYGPEEAESAANIFFQQFDAKMYKPEIIAQGKTLLINSGMKGADADRIIDQITEGGYAGPGDMAEDLSKTALDHVKSLFYGRPTSSTTVNVGGQGLGNPEQQLGLAQQGVSFERGGLADVGVPSWMLTRELGIEAPSRSTMEQGMRGFYDPQADRVEFETTLKGDVGKQQSDFAQRLEAITNENPALKHTFINYFATGGMKKDAKQGLMLRDYAQTRQVTEEGAVVPKPKFLIRDEDGKPKRVDVNDFWED